MPAEDGVVKTDDSQKTEASALLIATLLENHAKSIPAGAKTVIAGTTGS